MQFFNTLLLNFTAFFLAIAPVPTYKEGVVGRPLSFFSNKAVSQHEHTVSSLIYRGLFKYDIYGAIIPDLADTWTVSEDGLSYTIKLKDDQFWTNGDQITSDDLIYTAFTNPNLAGVATDKVDKLTVRYTLPNKYAPFLSLLSEGVIHSNSNEKENPLMPISSGDWRVVSIEKTGNKVDEIILRTRNETYQINKIIFRYYSNESELETAAKLGEIDGFLANDVHKLSNFNDYTFPEQGIYYALYFNLTKEKLQDVELRKKLQKVLHTDELIFDRGISVEGPISRSIFTDRDLKFDTYDGTFSEDLSDTSIEITIPDNPEHKEFVDRIKNVWEDKLEMEVSVKTVSPKEIIEKTIKPRDFEVLFYGQEVGRDPDRYVNWHSTQKGESGLNLSSFENVRGDRALEEGRKNYDNDARIIHYNEFQKSVVENVPAIFMYHPFVHYYVSKYIEGIGQKYTFTQSDRFLDFVNWKRISTN